MTKPAHTTPPPDAAARRGAPPVLTYSVEQLPSFDAAFYNRARAEVSEVAELTVPPWEAKAFEVSAGHFFRIVSVEGPQVGDLNLWNPHDLIDLLVALSACPGGDCGSSHSGDRAKCYPLNVEIHRPRASASAGWQSPP